MALKSWGDQKIARFIVTYDGVAIKTNEIDVKILAESLLGISAAIEEANKVVYGDYSRVFLRVHAEFKPGSFGVELVEFLTSENFQAAVNLITVLGFCGVGGALGVIQVYKIAKGGRIVTQGKIDGDNTEIHLENCENPIIVKNAVVKCYQNEIIKKELSRVTVPLDQEGISVIAFSSDECSPEIISVEDREFFRVIDTDETERIIDEQIDIGYFVITQSNLEGSEKGWRMGSGSGSTFPVTISDHRFLEMVKQGKISFSHGSTIRAKFKRITKQIENIVQTTEIIEVYEYYPPNASIPRMIRKDKQLLHE